MLALRENNPSQQPYPLVSRFLEKGKNLSLLIHGRKVLLAPQTQTRSAQLTSVTRTKKLSLVYQTPLHNVWISTTLVEGRIKTLHCNTITPKPHLGPSTKISSYLASGFWLGAQEKSVSQEGTACLVGHFLGQHKTWMPCQWK